MDENKPKIGRKTIYDKPMSPRAKQSRARMRSYLDFTAGSMDASKVSTSNLISMLPKFFAKTSPLDAETRQFYAKRIVQELQKRADEIK